MPRWMFNLKIWLVNKVCEKIGCDYSDISMRISGPTRYNLDGSLSSKNSEMCRRCEKIHVSETKLRN